MKNYYTIAIVILVLLALFLLGLIIFQNRQSSQNNKPLQSVSQDTLQEARGERGVEALFGDTTRKDFMIFIGEDTEIVGIAQDNPYFGERPAPLIIGGDDRYDSFEIWGDVIFVDKNAKVILIFSDYPRPINTDFTPRGLKISLADIKTGDRIIASGSYDAQGEPDFGAIKFIQITPLVEGTKRLPESQKK